MSGSSRIQIGDPVSCSGAACGTVMRMVIDPAAGVITHLAVGPHQGGGRLVPFACVTSTLPDIELTCTQAEFDAFLPDQDQELVADAAESFAKTTPYQPAAGILSVYSEIAPVGITRQLPAENMLPETRTFDRVPAGEEELKPGEQVKATDGPVGRVTGLAVDLATRRISHVLIDAGHLWRKRHIAIPIDHVDHIGMNVHISLTKQQIGDLDQS